ncbi:MULTISPECIES: DUF2489 domain-containing protein [Gammaproteobacteria]|uniref:DUF2489 domain-containing protein n=1 Tax=Gammaproteobacteria TaxID=1236 RepID=UPI000DCF73CE|nr:MULTISPECIES: DUF2489 domain-containing protein [Gammaproteobacteria]RTE86653.1 DUF2489 domain-containing protein [Aliidiomarina sp. B3213]TCZ90792.1 DUF2489 domain-containing protein [Lysobacter sp. N42]
MIWWILGALGVAIILALSVYAGMLLSQLSKQRKENQAGENKRVAYIHESILTIAKAMQQGQCDLSEGSIRISVLLDNLPEAGSTNFDTRFPAIHEMYEKIKHMPTHGARKEYPKKEIRKLDREREALEVEMETTIQADVTEVIAFIQSKQ